MFEVLACSLGGLLVVVTLSPTSVFVPGNLGTYGDLHRKAEAHSGVGYGFLGVHGLTETRLSLIGEGTEEGFGRAIWDRKEAQSNSSSSYLVNPVGI